MTASDDGICNGAGICGWGNLRGFTFIEVMVAMAVIALVMTSLFRMQSGSFELASAEEFCSVARLLARQQLALMEQDPDEWNGTDGDFGPENEDYEWTCEVLDVEFDKETGLPKTDAGTLKKIDLTISQSQGGRSFHVETFRYVPASK